MICYRDRTYCKFYPLCKHGHTCKRALTPEVVEHAKEWWGDDSPPICVHSDFPECFVPFFEGGEGESNSKVPVT